PELVLHDPESREVDVEVVGEIRDRAHDGSEQRDGNAIEEGFRLLDLAVAPLAEPFDALLHLPCDLAHALLVRPGDLDARELAATLDRDLEEHVDAVAEHDPSAGDDAVQAGILPDR